MGHNILTTVEIILDSWKIIQITIKVNINIKMEIFIMMKVSLKIMNMVEKQKIMDV